MSKNSQPARRFHKAKTFAKPKPSGEDTGTFLAALAQASRLATVQVEESELASLAERLQAQHREPLTQRRLNSLRARAHREEARLRSASNGDWSDVEGRTLLLLIEGYLNLLESLRRFPSLDRHLSDDARRELYLRVAIIRAEDEGDDPMPRLNALVLFHTLGPFAMYEVERRFEGRSKISALTGVAGLIMAQEGDDFTPLLEVLRRTAWKHVAKDLRHRLSFEDICTELNSAAGEVLATRLGRLHPLEAVSRGLDGDWKMVPTAIGNALTKQHARGQLPRGIELVISDLEDTRTSGDEPLDVQADRRLRENRVSRDPKLQAAWDVLVDRQRQKSVAKKLKVTDRTLRNWIRDKLPDLKKLL